LEYKSFLKKVKDGRNNTTFILIIADAKVYILALPLALKLLEA